jgi:hypothetical protein
MVPDCAWPFANSVTESDKEKPGINKIKPVMVAISMEYSPAQTTDHLAKKMAKVAEKSTANRDKLGKKASNSIRIPIINPIIPEIKISVQPPPNKQAALDVDIPIEKTVMSAP